MLKRRTQGSERVLKVGDLTYDLDTLTITRAAERISLRPTTRKILELLMRSSHRVVTRAEIEKEIWADQPPEGDALRVHIYSIRNAIDKPFPVKLLHTVHGTGYRLMLPDEKPL